MEQPTEIGPARHQETFVAALDARTGRERWRSNRDEIAED